MPSAMGSLQSSLPDAEVPQIVEIPLVARGFMLRDRQYCSTNIADQHP